MRSLTRLLGSTRARITIVSIVVVGAALVAGGLVLDATLRAGATRALRGSAAAQVGWLESLGSAGSLPKSLPPVDASRLTLVQVVDTDHRVIAASEQLAGMEVEIGEERGPHEDGEGFVNSGRRDDRRSKGGPWFVESAPATVNGEAVTLVVYTSFADSERALEAIDGAVGVAVPLLLGLVAVASWVLVGRALRPVERMRQEVDAITAGSLSSRVVEPAVIDEVGRLAITLNSMLGRLQASADRQRRFIADASHELRTPVANVAAALDVARRYPDRADWLEVATDVAAQNQRMARLIDDLLVIARAEHADDSRSLRSVSVGQLVSDEIQQLGNDTRTMVHLIEPQPGVELECNAHGLERIIANVLENAIRHAVTRVEVSIEHDADAVTITVVDDGPGVPVDERERIFEPWVRLDQHRARPGGGAGLGLAIVSDLVAAAGGTISVESGSLGGAAFVVRLPRGGASRQLSVTSAPGA